MIHTSYDDLNFWNTCRRTKLEPIRLSVTTRTGNKKATLVDNLDYYGISPADVVHQVQRIAAASATGTYVHVPHLYWYVWWKFQLAVNGMYSETYQVDIGVGVEGQGWTLHARDEIHLHAACDESW